MEYVEQVSPVHYIEVDSDIATHAQGSVDHHSGHSRGADIAAICRSNLYFTLQQHLAR